MRTLVGDTDYQVLPTDTLVILNEPITAPRTWTLPQGGVFDGDRLTIIDGTDSVDETNTLTIDAPADVYLNGVSGGTFVLTTPGGLIDLVPIGSSSWKLVCSDQAEAEVAAQLDGMIVRNLTIRFNTEDIDTGAVLATPAAGEMIVAIVGTTTEAWNSSVSDALDLGYTGATDVFCDGDDLQVAESLVIDHAVADGYVFDGETDIIATVVSSGDAPTEGIASFTLITAPATLPEA